MNGTASDGEKKGLWLACLEGIPSNVRSEAAKRCIGNSGPLHQWIELGLSVNLGQVDMAAVTALVRPNLLEQIGTSNTTAITTFDVAAHIRVMTEKERKTAEVPIGWMNDDAQRIVKGLVETDVAAATLRRYNLLRNSVDEPIIAELGGGDDITLITTRWAQMYEMMKAQAHGEEGDLLVNGYANIFYIPDKDGTVWAAICRWRSSVGYWNVYALPVTFPDTWCAGRQVFSR